jgi:heme-degrading monooxygenase HmoA
MNTHPKLLLTVRFKTSLPQDELEVRYKKRMPQFREIPGLLQKYYFHDPANDEWGGVYLWESGEHLEAYKNSELRKSIAEAFQVVGTPRIEVIKVVDVLKPEVRL